MAKDDEILTKRAIAGDREAQGLVWLRERPWMAAFLWSRSLDEELTAELLQEAAMILVSKIRSLREPRALRSWLRQALLNRLNDLLRDRFRAGSSLEELDRPPEAPVEAEPRPEFGAVLQELPIDLREVLVLRGVEGLKVKEVAEILDLNVTTVETRLVRARKLLRERLERSRRRDDEPMRKVL